MKKSIDIRLLVRQADKSVRKGYNVPLVATHQEFSAGHASDTLTVDCSDAIKNADNGRASVVGCNCNNSNASVRTVNGNNSAVNSNNNYCGGSALIYLGKSIMACPPRTNITDRHVGTAAHASCEYDLPPFCMIADMDSRKAESKADNVRELLAEIHEVNTHKRLKNLRRYITDKRIIAMAIDKMLDGKPHKKSGEYVNVEAQYFSDHTDEVAEIISNDLKNGTYRIGDNLYCSSNGSEEIKNAMDYIHDNGLELPQSVTIKRLSGNKFYFDEFHTSLKEAFDIITKNLNI